VSTLSWILWIVGGFVVISVAAAIVGRHFVKRGMSEPFIVRTVNQVSERVIDTVRHPITVAVLDEVADVLRTGHYTKNLASALRENEAEIKAMVAEKLKDDPTTRAIGLVPFHDRIINVATETTLRVILEVLADPRTDELVSDVLRDNIIQLREAVRSREHEKLGDFEAPDPAPPDSSLEGVGPAPDSSSSGSTGGTGSAGSTGTTAPGSSAVSRATAAANAYRSRPRR
jgi:hypothetical protein